MYNQKLLEIFKNPINAGGLQGANGTAKLGFNDGAIVIKFYILVNENGIIENARFKTMGTANVIAVSSILTSLVIGKSIEEAKQIATKDILEAIGIDADKTDSLFIDECEYCQETMLYTLQDYITRKEKEEKKNKQNNE